MHMGRRQVPDGLVVPFLGSGLSEGNVGSGIQDRAGTNYRLCPEPGLGKKTGETEPRWSSSLVGEERLTRAVIRK